MSTARVFGEQHPLLAALAGARDSLAEAGECAAWSLSDDQVMAALGELFGLRAQVEALTAAQVAQADIRVFAARVGLSGTARWLRRRFRVSRQEADRLRDLAVALPACPGTAGALAAGVVGVEQATAMTRAMAELPSTTGRAERDRAEVLLLEQAATLEPEELARCGRALREALTTTPDVDDPAEAALLAAGAEQAEAAAARHHALEAVRLRPLRDGMTRLDGLLAPLTAAAVRAALGARAGRVRTDDGVRDPRTREQRMAAALHDLALTGLAAGSTGLATAPAGARADTDQSPGAQPVLTFDAGTGTDQPDDDDGGGEVADVAEVLAPSTDAGRAAGVSSGIAPAQVTLLVDWDSLQRMRPRAGTLDDGTPLAPSDLLTALCDAAVLPVVFTGASRPLHLGRRRRAFPPAQRDALAARDRGCTFPGCTRPPAGTAAHHLVHWADGGNTDIDNGALLCPYHHGLVHRENWQGQLATNGHIEYVPPYAFDPDRRPRQHLRYRGSG